MLIGHMIRSALPVLRATGNFSTASRSSLSSMYNLSTARGFRVHRSSMSVYMLGGIGVFVAGVVTTNVSETISLCDAALDEGKDRSAGSVMVTEPFTGVKFPRTIEVSSGLPTGIDDPPADKEPQQLVWQSVRCMMGLCNVERARVYAYALYVNPKDVPYRVSADTDDDKVLNRLVGPPRLRKFSTRPKQDVEVKAEAAAGFIPVTLRMVVVREAAGGHLAKGFDRGLLQRVRHAQKGKKGEGKAALRQFVRIFSRRKMWTPGTVLDFTRLKDGSLVVAVDGEVETVLRSSQLSWALLDLYVGPDGHFGDVGRHEVIGELRRLLGGGTD